MKSIILIALLAATSVSLAAVYQSRHVSSVGVPQPGDWVLTMSESIANPIPNVISSMTVESQLHPIYKVNYITFTDLDPSQEAFVSFVGGLGTNTINYIITSQRGRGFHIVSRLWGYDTTEQTSFMRSIVHTNCTMTMYDGQTMQTTDCN